MKPEHFKPFNVEHAKAGAPYCCRNGSQATVLKWDAQNHAFPLVGTIIFCEGNEQPESWTVSGTRAVGRGEGESDLVMLPLGYIDGKPVFVGDKFEYADGCKREASPGMRNFDDCRWPEPDKVYPATAMSAGELVTIYKRAGCGQPLRAVANAALRHAIDNGYAATKEAYDQCSRDLGKAERLLEALGYRSAGNGEWEARDCAARDMAVAEAVLQEAFAAMREGSYEFWPMRLNKLNLPSIIAKISA